ncbi:MAG: CBU_0592 family membrane protein [Nanoarchaeota archaeon]
MLDLIILIIGICGFLLIASNYFLEATNVLGKDHKLFSILNLAGSSFLLVYSWYHAVWLFVILNLFLVIVGLAGIVAVFMRKAKNRNKQITI